MKTKISFLVPDLGSNILGATRRLAGFLQAEYEVEIVGPCLGGKTNAMYADGFPYKVVDAPRAYRIPEYFAAVRALAKATTGDLVIAMKAYAPSLPAALRVRKRRGAKVIAYLDEWDGATAASWAFSERIRHLLRDWPHPVDDLYAPHWERRLRECDAIIGTTTFLARRFNATRIHLGADTDFFAPRPADETAALRHSLGLDGTKLVVFGGVLRRHKGAESYLEALAKLRPHHDVHCLVVGPRNDEVGHLLAKPRFQPFCHCTGAVSWTEMPKYLALADALMVPLSDSLMARSQMPCKVFEAMAMQKPIVSTAISDLPEILDGCGWLAPPGDSDALATAFADIFDHPAAAAARAVAARDKCLRLYSARRSQTDLLAFLSQLSPPA